MIIKKLPLIVQNKQFYIPEASMKILVINCGSSSIKYQLFDMTDERVAAKGIAEKIGLPMGVIKLSVTATDRKVEENTILPNHEIALNRIMEIMTAENVIRDKSDIKGIGHRLVHAGEFYASSVKVTDDVIEKMTICNDLAPLHNPHNITGVRTSQKLFPGTFQAGCFDTAFHQTMPDYAYIYPIDYSWYEKFKVRRYGFHGTSHFYVSQRAADMLGKNIEDLRIITCHLGNGSSIAAIKYGKSVDTSMGMTPLEGIMMGTRSGDIDPALVFFAVEKGMSLGDFNNMLNKKSGLQGVSGISSDMRDINKARSEGSYRAQLAYDMFSYKIKKYIGSYAAAMGGLDALIFTGGIGENNPHLREIISGEMEFFGISMDKQINNSVMATEKIISDKNSKVKVMVVPTNEELVIARETLRLYDMENK